MARNSEATGLPGVLSDVAKILQGGSPRERVMLIGLTALFLLQIGLSAWVYWPRPGTFSTPVPIFAELSVDDVVRVNISDDAGERIQLVKDAGRWWVLLTETAQEGSDAPPLCGQEAAAPCFPAANDRVELLLNTLAELTTSRLVANSEASYTRLRVAADKYVRRVEFQVEDDTRHTLYIGTAPRFGATHVRAANHSAVYLADTLSGSDAQAAVHNWIDTLYFQVAASEIRSLQIVNANGALEFTQDENGLWRMAALTESEQFNPGPLFAMLPFLTNLSMVEPLGKQELAEYGMEQPNAILTLTTVGSDGESHARTLAIGAHDEQGLNYVVKSSSSPYYVLASGYSVGRLIESARDDFLTPPQESPTPAPEAGQQ